MTPRHGLEMPITDAPLGAKAGRERATQYPFAIASWLTSRYRGTTTKHAQNAKAHAPYRQSHLPAASDAAASSMSLRSVIATRARMARTTGAVAVGAGAGAAEAGVPSRAAPKSPR